MVVMIGVVSVIAPASQENDPRPTVTNMGPHGAKAAYMTLQALGVKTSRWDRSLTDLNEGWSDAQVRRTTLVLAAPAYDPTQQKALAAEVKRFLERGGRVLATGPSGAELLPEGEVSQAGMMAGGNCQDDAGGAGGVGARAGRVEMVNSSQWSRGGTAVQGGAAVRERCGGGGVCGGEG